MAVPKDLGYAEWLNQYGWMETMKGSRWNKILKQNQNSFEQSLNDVKSLQEDIQNELKSSVSYVEPLLLEDVYVQMMGTLRYGWKWKDELLKKPNSCADLDVESGNQIWFVEDRSSGAERYTLVHKKGDKTIWTSRLPLGPYVAVLGSRVYVLEAKNDLWYCKLVSFRKQTGKDTKVHLEIDDPRWNLTLLKGQNGCLFCVGNNAGTQRLWHIEESGSLKEVTGPYESFVPVGTPKGGTEPCFFARRVGSQTYEAVGRALQNEEFPNLKHNAPQWFCFSEHILCTRHYGKRSLWNTQTGKHIDTIIGDFEFNDLAGWKTGECVVTVARPGFDRVLYHKKDSLCAYATMKYQTAKSMDGTRVPLILLQSCPRPKALLCIAYGGYGLPTHLDVSRWKPLLRRGWVLCLCLVRGSGDHDDAWAESARRDKKVKSVEDLEACIRLAQKLSHISPRDTAIYGRSAGGYLVGATLARNPNGDLFGAVYTEVPYVDVLATTSNPRLPLTQLEYEEFGNPLERIANAMALIHLSPIHALPEEGAPHVFVLCRTGLNDKEVFAYEPVKWMTALQESQKNVADAQPKLLAITAGEGHFVGGSASLQQRAEDLALLVAWNKKSHARIYKNMANTRRNRRATRKNNAVTMGGKRKARKGTRKSTRKASKGRKGSRKH